MAETLLLVDDDVVLRETLALNLRSSGYEVLTAGDGMAALEIARERRPDLVILDLMLPQLDGLAVCRALRQTSSVPILMLTARSGELDKIVGLESGADDYMTKPFSVGELLARLRALRRRAGAQPLGDELRADGPASGPTQPLVLNLVSRRATLGGHELLLSPKEFNLLAEFLRQRGAALSRDLLLARVWGLDYPGDTYLGDTRTVDVHIRWLREKIEADPSDPRRIVTVRGIGYRFEG